MSTYRRESQKSIGFYADKEFVALLNAHLKKKRMNKSQFIRDAIAEKMMRDGVKVPDELTMPIPPYASIVIHGDGNKVQQKVSKKSKSA